MNLDVLCICGLVGLAAGWLGFRWGAAWLRRKSGGCAGGCGCATKVGKKG
jgi:hypothetical protein